MTVRMMKKMIRRLMTVTIPAVKMTEIPAAMIRKVMIQKVVPTQEAARKAAAVPVPKETTPVIQAQEAAPVPKEATPVIQVQEAAQRAAAVPVLKEATPAAQAQEAAQRAVTREQEIPGKAETKVRPVALETERKEAAAQRSRNLHLLRYG